MAPSCYDVAASMLLCAEEHSSILCFEEEEEELEAVGRKRGRSPGYGDDFGVDLFPPQTEECVAGLVEREREHMPRADYGQRLRGDGVDLCVRQEAIDCIWKVYTYYNFRPLTAYLAVNYLDRFLSLYKLPEGKGWMTQLLSVACVSLAAKMEETAVPQCLDLQVGDARFVFEAKTIQRMELLVLTTLNWRMQAVTPFSYVDYFLNRLSGGNAALRNCLFQSAELILCAARGTSCIGFRPSEIAAAVAAAVVGEVDVAGIENACAHVDKERVLRCQEAIQSMAFPVPVPQSPVGVLDAGYLSYKSEDDAAAAATAASHGASGSSSSSPVTSKRRKLTSR
ncbi:cyclin delta-2 [Zea mays]|uniref:Cyclin delta-2 n=1 Tax=Zea mays TaxID=4577 RepID=B6UB23_MAIZE|nr:cyclin delta-2 [Zea mays]ACG46556.1 cyclin delta-2 [Zea mays]|eukprot:NP_001152238.1 cyclin delta-2 [Zea mays]